MVHKLLDLQLAHSLAVERRRLLLGRWAGLPLLARCVVEESRDVLRGSLLLVLDCCYFALDFVNALRLRVGRQGRCLFAGPAVLAAQCTVGSTPFPVFAEQSQHDDALPLLLGVGGLKRDRGLLAPYLDFEVVLLEEYDLMGYLQYVGVDCGGDSETG